MGTKALLLINIIACSLCLLVESCHTRTCNKGEYNFEKVDLSKINLDTISTTHYKLTLQNGVYYLDTTPYSGFITVKSPSGNLKSIGSYYRGRQQGATKTFFANGQLETIRNYRDGLAYGLHQGYWSNGKLKFEFHYNNDKREGTQKQWYESGNKFYELSFSNDQEFGMQKAWRENGKVFMNYEAVGGKRYGLQKAALCYTLKNEKAL